MAAKNVKVQPETVVIQNGTSFGSAFAFMLLGALLGSAATILVARSSEQSAQDAVQETARATERKAEKLQTRLGRLAKRATFLAGRAKDAALVFNEHVRPALQDAIHEGSIASHEMTQHLQNDIRQDFPAKKPFDDLTSEEA